MYYLDFQTIEKKGRTENIKQEHLQEYITKILKKNIRKLNEQHIKFIINN